MPAAHKLVEDAKKLLAVTAITAATSAVNSAAIRTAAVSIALAQQRLAKQRLRLVERRQHRASTRVRQVHL